MSITIKLNLVLISATMPLTISKEEPLCYYRALILDRPSFAPPPQVEKVTAHKCEGVSLKSLVNDRKNYN
ncbi:hypothetical protein V6Z12_D08G115800 [Gossypium hirsutum]